VQQNIIVLWKKVGEIQEPQGGTVRAALPHSAVRVGASSPPSLTGKAALGERKAGKQGSTQHKFAIFRFL